MRDCRSKNVQQVNCANQVEEKANVLCAFSAKVEKNNEVWYIDSGYSNHMTAHESLLIDLDINFTGKMKMGDGNIVKATGRGTLVMNTKKGRICIREVMLVPGLDENLLSVGQMMEHGYLILFGGTVVKIYDDRSLSNIVTRVEVKNRSFPLMLKYLEEVAKKASVTDVGLEKQLTAAYSPQQNGIAERKNRTIVEMAKSMMHEKNMPYTIWGETVNTAVYLLNRCPTKALDKKTPFEVFSGRKPYVKHLRVFGSVCYTHIPQQLRQKLEKSSNKGVFMGYGTIEKGNRVYNLSTQKIILSRDVIFDKDSTWNWETRVEEKDNVSLQLNLNKRKTKKPMETSIQEEVTENDDIQETPQQASICPQPT
ncbi:uncharacterized protein [Malus domestica]|uniref:uncharacterized protein n=1 Tax=Malus domestica TaxID=3750 RepID=UPI0039765C2F